MRGTIYTRYKVLRVREITTKRPSGVMNKRRTMVLPRRSKHDLVTFQWLMRCRGRPRHIKYMVIPNIIKEKPVVCGKDVTLFLQRIETKDKPQRAASKTRIKSTDLSIGKPI
jgi:hypothetical protein